MTCDTWDVILLRKSPAIERSKTIDPSATTPVFSWFSNWGFFFEPQLRRVWGHKAGCTLTFMFLTFFLLTYYRISNSLHSGLAWVLSSSFFASLAGTGNFLVRAAVLGEIIPLCLNQAQSQVNRDIRLLTKSMKLILWSLISLNSWESFASS